MLKLSKLPWIAAGILVISTALSIHYAVGQSSALRQARLDLATANLTVAALEVQIDDYKATTVVQTEQRQEAKKKVQAVRTETKKEENNDPSPRPELTDAQLDRLRRLTEAANSAINSASELP